MGYSTIHDNKIDKKSTFLPSPLLISLDGFQCRDFSHLRLSSSLDGASFRGSVNPLPPFQSKVGKFVT